MQKFRVTHDGPDTLLAEKWGRQFRYSYRNGQWQEFVKMRWTDISQDEIFDPRPCETNA